MNQQIPRSEGPGLAFERPPVPRVVRIMPSRTALWAAIATGLTLTLVFGWLAANPYARVPTALCWLALGVSVVVAIGSSLRLLLQLPLIEASELGIAIWLHGPYRRPFFAPWSRVQSIGLTQVRGRQRMARRDALGIALIHDDQFHLPALSERGELPVDGAPRADLAWSNRLISGDLRDRVKMLQQMRSVCEGMAE